MCLLLIDILNNKSCKGHAEDGSDVCKGTIRLHFVEGLAAVLQGFAEVG